ncbi:M81 family metallopeptidase [Limobrevibacterium gyesilva]|uniref:Microcystinase C n=1 Tax=Limobrevibacterium gyesilva TaxID=2991712 RepID=A0AA41YNR8_9PROT|nr:M81 family metallopeptidase [Limobrevibacterium gyesilva]MCW3475916.1 M81 family metallopeptidase [Limobrevibacterium gyesilva]
MGTESPRIAILGLHLEANAFAPPTTRADFEAQCWEEGETISRLARDVSHLPSELPGFYARMDETGPWTPAPLIIIGAPPGGPIEQALFLDFLDRVRNRLVAALPVDAVYVASHGASSATGDEDSDGTLLAMVRQIVGPAVPIVVTHDLHCNVSERLVEAADSVIAYRTNPHVDQRERAAEAADLLRAMLAGLRTAKAFIRMPIAPPSVTLLTADGPYADLIRLGQELTTDPILNISVTGGFVFADIPKCGMTINVTSRGDQEAADHAAQQIARAAWADRARYRRRLTPLADAVDLARQSASGAIKPIILADVADNPGGGGRGNTTWLLAALHEAMVPGFVLGVFIDPDLAADAHRAGAGAHLHAVFNRAESAFSKRFESGATIEKLTGGTDIGRRGSSAGKRFNMGPSALLRLDGSGLRVVVASLRRQLAEPRMLEMHDIDIALARCVVVKSRGHFRAGFDEFFDGDSIFEVDTPGLTSPVLANFAWRRLQRPIWPLDEDARWG